MSLMFRSRWVGLYWLHAWDQFRTSVGSNDYWSNVYLYHWLLWRCWAWNLCSLSSKLWCLYWFIQKVCCMCWWHLLISWSILWRLLSTPLCWRSSQFDLCFLDWGSTIQPWMSTDLVLRHQFRLMRCYSNCILWDV